MSSHCEGHPDCGCECSDLIDPFPAGKLQYATCTECTHTTVIAMQTGLGPRTMLYIEMYTGRDNRVHYGVISPQKVME